MEGYSAQERLSSQSQQKLDTLRDEFAKEFEAYKQAGKFSVVAVGSLARLEACEDSDLDYFIISDRGLKASHFEHGLGRSRLTVANSWSRGVSEPVKALFGWRLNSRHQRVSIWVYA
ncbi:nucleotidyltransferase domain-containing protein [Salinisphaera sp. PC39]|uniref:nucleotidyltransferase domain-containing protein n=1 Tax=Salinisphaera sp. PC39 TaxID=1304156 RepID=UPI003340FDEF